MNQFSSNFFGFTTAVRSAGLCVSAFALFACGGTGDRLVANLSASTDGGARVDPCNPTATLEMDHFGCTPGLQLSKGTMMCADFEGYPAGNGGLPAGWFRYKDKIEETSSQFIDPAGIDSAAKMGDGAHCGGGVYAYHMLSQGQDVWGPQIGVQTAIDGSNVSNIDVSNWDGISFWVRQGNDYPELEPTGTSLFVSLRDVNTMPGSGCDDASNIDTEKCDPYGWPVGFDRSWRFMVLPFDDMKQRGYGVHEDALVRSQVKKLTFSMDIGDGANGNWNVWLDDIMLYKHKN